MKFNPFKQNLFFLSDHKNDLLWFLKAKANETMKTN